MRTALEALVVVGVLIGGLRLRPDRALLLLAAVVVLLPATLQLPNGVTPLPTASRLTAIAVGINLLRRRSPELFRATPLHRAAGAYAGIALLTGVLLAPATLPIGISTQSWLDLLDPLLVGLVALACARAAGPQAALRVLAVVALLAVTGGFVEHLSGRALSRLLVESDRLELRAGSRRVRVGSDFALAFSWTLAALVPAVVVVLRRRATGIVLGLAGCLAVEYWTFSRSIPLGLLVGVLVVAVGLRDVRVAGVLLLVTVLLGGLALSTPSIRHRFSAGVDQGAVNVRTERAPLVLDAVSRRPLLGLGLGGVAQLAIGETDESFLLSYAQIGALGAVSQLVVLACGLVLCGRGLRGPPSAGRSGAAAALAGAVVLVVGAVAFDAFAIRGSAGLLGLLLGIGAAAAEAVAGPATIARPLRDRTPLRVLVVGLATAGGLGVALAWPTHIALTAQFATLSPVQLVPEYNRVDDGRRLIATACAVAVQDRPRVHVTCVDSNLSPGVGRLRLEGTRTDELFAALTDIVNRVRTTTPVHDLVAMPDRALIRDVPTAAGTAPWTFALLAALLALLVPTEPLRRLHARTRSWEWGVARGDLLAGQPGSGGA